MQASRFSLRGFKNQKLSNGHILHFSPSDARTYALGDTSDGYTFVLTYTLHSTDNRGYVSWARTWIPMELSNTSISNSQVWCWIPIHERRGNWLKLSNLRSSNTHYCWRRALDCRVITLKDLPLHRAARFTSHPKLPAAEVTTSLRPPETPDIRFLYISG